MDEKKKSQSEIMPTNHNANDISAAITTQTSVNSESNTTYWEYLIPWLLTGTSTLVLCAVGWFLAENLIWLREESFNNYDINNLSYRSHTFYLYMSSIRSSVRLFSGVALMFLGIGVSFYTIKSQTNLKVGAQNLTIGLVTASPGILAMVLGVFLIAYNVKSKDMIPLYNAQHRIGVPKLSGYPPDFQRYPAESTKKGLSSPLEAK